MNLIALHDQIIVKTDMYPEKIGSFFVPETSKWQRMNFGTVVSVGKKHREVNVGDRVVYSRYHGKEFEVDGERHLVLDEDEVLATI